MADEDEIEIEETEETEEVVGEDLEIDDLTEVVDPDFDPDADAVEGEDFDPDVLTGDLVVDLTSDGATTLSDEGSTLAPVDPTKPKSADDDEDEDDLRTEDDVEADLSSILQEKLASPQETAPEEEDEVVGDDRTDGVERLQPRRPDETQCSHCFLLVRQTAPGCPVEDDACPLFTH